MPDDRGSYQDSDEDDDDDDGDRDDDDDDDDPPFLWLIWVQAWHVFSLSNTVTIVCTFFE